MTTIAVGTYCRFQDKNGSDQGLNLQNFHQGESRSFDGATYTFGNFSFSGSTVESSGANVQAELVFAVNELILNTAKTASDNRWIVRVQTVWLDPETLVETGAFVSEVYAVLGYSQNSGRMSWRLGSPIDAIAANVPRRVLATKYVGSLPNTGSIPLS
jgi:hypothetical protein